MKLDSPGATPQTKSGIGIHRAGPQANRLLREFANHLDMGRLDHEFLGQPPHQRIALSIEPNRDGPDLSATGVRADPTAQGMGEQLMAVADPQDPGVRGYGPGEPSGAAFAPSFPGGHHGGGTRDHHSGQGFGGR